MLRILRYCIAAGLGAAVVGMLLVTAQLARLESGMQANLTAGRQLVAAQRAIRDRGAALDGIVGATRRIGDGLDALIAQGQALERSAVAVAQSNRETLALNQSILDQTAATEADLNRVASALTTLGDSTAAIKSYMIALRQTVAADTDTLASIGANTSRLNVRTPGW